MSHKEPGYLILKNTGRIYKWNGLQLSQEAVQLPQEAEFRDAIKVTFTVKI